MDLSLFTSHHGFTRGTMPMISQGSLEILNPAFIPRHLDLFLETAREGFLYKLVLLSNMSRG